MELPSAGFQSDNGAEVGLVAQDLPDNIHTDWLGLRVDRQCNNLTFHPKTRKFYQLFLWTQDVYTMIAVFSQKENTNFSRPCLCVFAKGTVLVFNTAYSLFAYRHVHRKDIQNYRRFVSIENSLDHVCLDK